MPKIINLISNQEDNNHCFQACYAMVQEAFTGKKVTLNESEELTGFVTEKPTWPYQGLLSWAANGLFVKYIENFPLDSFILNPEATIKNHVQNDQIAQGIISISNFPKEIEYVKLCLSSSNITFEERKPTISDIKNYLAKDCLIVANVNYWALLEEDKYSGHFVVLQYLDGSDIILQNPGLPAIANQRVSLNNFVKAWHWPNDNLANLIIISLKPL